MTDSGVQLTQSDRVQFHYLHTTVSSQFKSQVGNILTKAAALWITLNIDGSTTVSKSHTHPSHSQTSRLLTSSLSLGVPLFHSIKMNKNIQTTSSCFFLQEFQSSDMIGIMDKFVKRCSTSRSLVEGRRTVIRKVEIQTRRVTIESHINYKKGITLTEGNPLH